MADIATLSIKVDTSDIGRAKKELDQLIDKLKTKITTSGASGIAKQMSQLSTSVNTLAASGNAAAGSMSKFVPELKKLSGVKLPDTGGIKSLVEALYDLSFADAAGLAEVAKSIKKIFTQLQEVKGVVRAGDKFAQLAEGLRKLSSIKSLDNPSIGNIREVIDAMQDLAKIRGVALRTSASSIANFAETLARLPRSLPSGQNLGGFVRNMGQLSEVNTENLAAVSASVDLIVPALTKLAGVESFDPKVLGGVAKSMTTLSQVDVQQVKEASAAFWYILKAVGDSQVVSAAAEAIPALNGVVEAMKGVSRISISENAVKSITALFTALAKVGSVNTEAIDTASMAISSLGVGLKSFPEKVPSTAGMANMIKTLESLSALDGKALKATTKGLGGALSALGEGLAAMPQGKGIITPAKVKGLGESLQTFNGIEASNVSAVGKAALKLGEGLKALPSTGVITGDALKNLVGALYEVAEVDNKKVRGVSGALSALGAGLTAMAGVKIPSPATLSKFADSLASLELVDAAKLGQASDAIQKLGLAAQGLKGFSTKGLANLPLALDEFTNLDVVRLGPAIAVMRGIGKAAEGLKGVTGNGLKPLATGLNHLAQVDPVRLTALATAMARIGNASARLTAGSDSVRQLAQQTLLLEKRLTKMERTSRKAQQTLRDAGRTAGGATGRLRGLSQILRNLTTTLVGTFGIVRFVRSSTRAISEFELGMVDIAKTANLTDMQMVALGKSFVELGTSAIATTSELQKVGIVAGQLGIAEPEQIGKFADAITRLSDGAPTLRGNLDQTALSLTQLLQVTGGSVDDIGALSSSLLKLGNTSKATEEQILKTGIEVASATAAFNVSAEEALGLATALAQVRVPPERGRTAIITTMKNIADALDEGGQRARNFAAVTGQSLNQLRTQFQKSGGESFASLVEGLANVQREGGNVTATLRTLGLNSIRTQTSILALLEGSDQLATKMDVARGEFDKYGKALASSNGESLKSTELMRVSERAADTLAKSIERTKSLFRAFATGITGETTVVGKAIRGAVELFDDLLRSVLGLEVGFGKYRERVEEAAEAVAELFGLNPDKFTQFFKDEATYNKTLEAIKTGLVGVGALMAALAAKATIAAVAFTGGLALIPIALAAAAAAIFHFRDETITVFGETTTVAEAFGNALKFTAAFAVALGETMYAQLKFVGTIFVEMAKVAYEAARDIWKGFEELFMPLAKNNKKLESDWRLVMMALVQVSAYASSAMIELLLAPFARVRGALKALSYEQMRKAIDGDDEARAALEKSLNEAVFGKNLVSVLSDAHKEGRQAAKDAGIAFMQGLNAGEGISGGIVRALFEGMAGDDALEKALKSAGGNPFTFKFFEKAFEGAKGTLDKAAEAALGGGDGLSKAFESLKSSITLALDTEAAEKLIESLNDVDRAIRDIKNQGADLRAELTRIRRPLTDLGSAIAEIEDKATETARVFKDDFGTDVPEGTLKAVENLIKANSEFEKLIALQEQANSRADTFASTMVDGIADVVTGVQSIEDAFKNVFQSLSREAVNFALEPLKAQLRGLMSGVFGAPSEEEIQKAAGAIAESEVAVEKSLMDTSDKIGAALGANSAAVVDNTGKFKLLSATQTSMNTAIQTATAMLESFAAALSAAPTNIPGFSYGTQQQGPTFREPFGPPEAPALDAAKDMASLGDTVAKSTPQLASNTAAFATLEVATRTAAAALQSIASAKAAAGGFGITEGLFGPPEASAKGNAFWGGGSVHAFAKGGAFGGGLRGRFGDMLTNGPVGFPMGIAGEAGPEAIVPISRMGGSFGMGVAGGGRVPLTRDGSGNLVADLSGMSSRGIRQFASGAILGAGSRAGSHGMSNSGYNGNNVTQNITIQANDVESFRRSERQIQRSLRRGTSNRSRNQ